VVWRLLPKLLEMPSLKVLEQANDLLAAENLELNTQVGRTRQELDLINDRFEKALTGSNITVFSQDCDLHYTWIHNPRFGFSPEDVLGKLDQDVLPEEAAEEVTQLKRQVIETGESASTYLAVESEEAGTVFFDLIVHPTRDHKGSVDGVLCTAIDMTEKNLYEIRLASLAAQFSQANQRFENALDGSLITVFEQDRNLKYVHIINPPPGTQEEQFIGKTDAEIFEAEDQLKLVPVKQQVIETGESRSLEIDVGVDGTEKTYNVRLDPARNAEGDVVGVLGTAVDLTYKRENERQMHLVMRELTHRSKNLLAVIQAMARQTAARSDSPETFVETFSARLQAMAASHDLLVSQSWYGADLKELVCAHLAQSIDPTSAQIEIDGAPLSISSDAAQNLGLALHELTTNAAKYGALSVVDGTLRVSWRVEAGQVTFNWEEAGGPEVTPPERNGFGRLLLEQLVGTSLDGTVSIDFRKEGVRCEIIFPAAQLVS
jgi:PAS domain S-box-containing protein